MELANQDLQISNSQAVNQFMLSKYTNQDLYQWVIGQISQTYFQSYQLAYDMAKRAERCYRFEIGVDDSNIIQFGYWDSLKKGLHAGERLQLDLRRLENTYLDQNCREFECTKHISLALYCPNALIDLRDPESARLACLRNYSTSTIRAIISGESNPSVFRYLVSRGRTGPLAPRYAC